MLILCRRCGKPFKEGQEVKGEFHAYWHDLKSAVHFSITRPHDYAPDTLEHIDCTQGD